MNLDADQYPRLPDKFRQAVTSFPECSYGAVRVTLVLRDGRWIRDVIVAGDAICKIGRKESRTEEDLGLQISDIIEVKRT